MIVVDASVAVKWFLSEAGEDEAAEILEGPDHLVAPALIRLEVAGAILRRFREGDLSERRAREASRAWDDMLEHRVVQLVPSRDLFDEAVELAFEVRHTISDCLYLVLAKRLDTHVVTADEPMWKRGGRLQSKIRLLAGLAKN